MLPACLSVCFVACLCFVGYVAHSITHICLSTSRFHRDCFLGQGHACVSNKVGTRHLVLMQYLVTCTPLLVQNVSAGLLSVECDHDSVFTRQYYASNIHIGNPCSFTTSIHTLQFASKLRNVLRNEFTRIHNLLGHALSMHVSIAVLHACA